MTIVYRLIKGHINRACLRAFMDGQGRGANRLDRYSGKLVRDGVWVFNYEETKRKFLKFREKFLDSKIKDSGKVDRYEDFFKQEE